MANAHTLLAQAYSAFNRRDIDSALALMSADVSWPKASEGGHVVGKDEIGAYWTRQWQQFDPHVEPIEMIDTIAVTDQKQCVVHVKVHQLVKSLSGEILSDSEVWHIYSFADGFIARMDLAENGITGATPSAAFSRHS